MAYAPHKMRQHYVDVIILTFCLNGGNKLKVPFLMFFFWWLCICMALCMSVGICAV